MQFSTLIIATLAAVASASPAVKRQADCAEVDQIPECGYQCIVDAAAGLGCAEADYTCMCGSFDELRNGAAGCVLEKCGLDGAPAVISGAEAVCAACA
ncbi:hypothetical protein VTI28DRAFT_2716 [Corynascus sepedonium]